MTLNEQIMKLQTYKMFEGEGTVYVERDDVLNLLEQQSCEDCISRQAVEEVYTEYCKNNCKYSLEQRDIMCDACGAGILFDEIATLPSVTPANVYIKGYKDAMAVHERLKVEHKGKWELTDALADVWHCSECGLVIFGKYEMSNFCPNCGADMRGEEE